MLLNRVILKYCTEEAGKEAFACARTPRLRLRLRGRFRCQLIIDSWLPWQDPPGSGTDCRGTIRRFRKILWWS